jgi:hypothetical protein
LKITTSSHGLRPAGLLRATSWRPRRQRPFVPRPLFFAGEKCNTWRSPRTWFFFNKLRHPLKATGLTDSDEGRRGGRRDWWRDWRWAAEIVTNRGIDDRRKIVAAYEAKLAEEKARRDKILADIRAASARADDGDQRARFELAGLNKQDLAAGRLILSLEAQVAEARKRLDMAMNQAAVVEAKSHAMAIPCDGAGKWRWFEPAFAG